MSAGSTSQEDVPEIRAGPAGNRPAGSSGPEMSRRRFLKAAACSALALQMPRGMCLEAPAPGFRNLIPSGAKMRIACVGVGGKGFSDLMSVSSEEIVALCDVDFERGGKAFREFPRAARYRDFRQMLNEMGGRIDGVMISTPDHMHFPAALMAMERGKHGLPCSGCPVLGAQLARTRTRFRGT